MVDFCLGLELAVHALLVHVKEVAGFAVAGNRAVLHAPRSRVLIRFPAVEGFAVEDRLPVFGGAGRKSESEQPCASQHEDLQVGNAHVRVLQWRVYTNCETVSVRHKAPSTTSY